MKKLIIGCLFGIGIIFSGCSSWEMTTKNWKTESTPMLRYVKVYDSMNKEVILEGDYFVYAKTSEGKTGDFSLLIRNEKEYKKLDFYGRNITLVMIEK